MAAHYSQPETSYALEGLINTPMERIDGRNYDDYRSLKFETGNSPSSSGSAYICGAGCEWQVCIKLDVVEGFSAGGLDAQVEYTSAAANSQKIPPLITPGLLSNLVNVTLSPIIPPRVFQILDAGDKSKWFRLQMSAALMSAENCSSSSIIDTLFLAVKMALSETRLPRTRPLVFEAQGETAGENINEDLEKFGLKTGGSGNKNRSAADFELVDQWHEGDPIPGIDNLPLSITLNVVQSIYFVDATSLEGAVPGLISYTLLFDKDGAIRGTQMLGSGELEYKQLPKLIHEASKLITDLFTLFNKDGGQLQDEQAMKDYRIKISRMELIPAVLSYVHALLITQTTTKAYEDWTLDVEMPTKIMFGIWALFDICLLVAGSVCISVSTAWKSPDLLRDLVINDEEKRAGFVLGILIVITVAYSTFAILRRRAIHLKVLNFTFILLAVFVIVIGSSLWLLSLNQRSLMADLWKEHSPDEQIKIQNHFECCGYQNTTDAGLFSEDAQQDFCLDLDNKRGCMTPIVNFASNYISSVYATMYGFIIILICLFLTTVCLLNERAKEDRFRRIDSKRSVDN
ncbi:hypothetical protein E3P96_03495 [Wallemia ichthyophaga]|nr:hypothetical protein E3P96_03495 [Wallemia ichthyophaga]